MDRKRSSLLKLDRRRVLIWVLALGWVVSISGVLGNRGLLQAYRLFRVKRELSFRVVALENEQARWKKMLQDLHTDAVFQEQTVRDSLGFVRENEIVFEFR